MFQAIFEHFFLGMVEFSDEEGYGRFLDLHEHYNQYLNIKVLDLPATGTFCATHFHGRQSKRVLCCKMNVSFQCSELPLRLPELTGAFLRLF